MADAQKLEGYLMKEKWKSGFLHGLTGDVNRRYFRVRTIEVKIKSVSRRVFEPSFCMR